MSDNEPKTPATHVAATPNKALSTVDTFKVQLEKDYRKQVENFFTGDKERAMRFMSALVYCVQKTPALLECSRESLLNASMACAELNLYPSNVAGEAFIIPYKGKATFQLGYQGLITLLYRAGVSSIQAKIVCEHDDFEYEEGLEPRLVHKPNVFGERGKPIGVYAVAEVNGTKTFHVMGAADVMRFKEFSQSAASSFSPWHEKQDPELWMWRKTCIKQLAKTLPKNETVLKAIAKDNEDGTLDRGALDAAGPAVGRAIHAPSDDEKTANPPRE